MILKIVAFDPSLSNWGIAQGSYDTETCQVQIDMLMLQKTEGEQVKGGRKNADDMRRARLLHEAMSQACRGYDFAIAEVPVGSQSARAMCSYGMCLGVLAACPIPLLQLTPTEVKAAAGLHKTASKQAMIDAAVKAFPYANWNYRLSKGKKIPTLDNEHRADAVWSLVAGVNHPSFIHRPVSKPPNGACKENRLCDAQ